MTSQKEIPKNTAHKIKRRRYEPLRRFEDLFESPMIILGFIWIILLIVELLHKSSPLLETIGVGIWIIFIIDFIIKFFLAPVKHRFIKTNVLTIVSLIIPAFRVFRILRFIRLLRLTRGLKLAKMLGGVNRGMRSLTLTMHRRAFGYVFSLILIVLFTGAAGMHAFENEVNNGLKDYGSSLWWTAMILTTMGTESWPVTTEGKILCLMLAVFAFGVFGYVTATIASFFIGTDTEDKYKQIQDTNQLEELKREIRELKELLKKK